MFAGFIVHSTLKSVYLHKETQLCNLYSHKGQSLSLAERQSLPELYPVPHS